MAWITDTLRSAIGRINPFRGHTSFGAPTVFDHQLAMSAYLCSGMMRKVIAVPAEDRVREWRDWQADQDDITKLEAEERRLGLQAKVQHAEILRGIGGGALILVTAGDHADELKPGTIAEGGLIAVNVVSRWQITGTDWVDDLADPLYGTPRMWRLQGQKGGTDIHPSRVVTFRGGPMPMGSAMSVEEAYWGDSRLLRVFREVQRSDETQEWFAALVRKAKLLRIGIPDLDQQDDETLNRRIEVIAMGESSLNATVYRSAAGSEDAGEKIDDYQVTWTGIPAMMDAFDQRVAAVSDIPFTRLTGRSPAGMNSTGQHDTDNWHKSVKAGQALELRPCLDQIDAALIPSAGVKEATWAFAPLDTPSEKEQADTFKTTVDALEKLNLMGVMPEEAFNELAQNLLAEREWMPGIDTVLAKFSDDERFGGEGDDDPSAIVEGGDPAASAEGGARNPASRANDSLARLFTDATPRPLYVRRDLKAASAKALIAWAKANGFEATLDASDMNVTVLYSKQPVDPMKMGESWGNDKDRGLIVKAGGPRAIERFGDAIVLQFASWSLVSRHNDMVRAGASHDFEDYLPHVTITYSAPEGLDLDAIKPFAGELRFGPEIFSPLDEDWKAKIEEK